MDTNINNYNIKEILTLIKLPENDCNLVNLYTIVSNIFPLKHYIINLIL